MDNESFRKHAHEVVDWVADYLANIEQYPVRSQVEPGDIINSLPSFPPESPEKFNQLMADFNEKIMPGITHWQHPGFHAYFPANASYPSIIGEIITTGIASQCMIWETSPAAAELEEQMMNWLKEAMDLPKSWHGVIQDTASTATLVAILTAREKATNWSINRQGFTNQKLRIYCSEDAHSSVDKAVKIAGIGQDNIVKIITDDSLSLKSYDLAKAIESDIKKGYKPCCIVASLGTTGTLAFDPLREIAEIASNHNIWLHVDAAYAGNAFILPEYRYLMEGIDKADSYVFNPHKWLMTNFDCTAYFVKSKEDLIQTFSILPEYLKTNQGNEVNNYRDWGIQLGRRFRALKLWFVLRTFGIAGLRNVIRDQIKSAEWFVDQVKMEPQFELLAPPLMNVIVFRYVEDSKTLSELNKVNEQILKQINDSGIAYLSHTKVNGKYAIRMVTGQLNTKIEHVKSVWNEIKSLSNNKGF